MLSNVISNINPFQYNISYAQEQKAVLHLIIIVLIIMMCIAIPNTLYIIFLIIICIYINNMSSSRENYTPEEAAIRYPCIGTATTESPLYEGQPAITTDQHALLQQASQRATCTSANANVGWGDGSNPDDALAQIMARERPETTTYGSVQQDWNDLISLFNIQPCLQNGDKDAAIQKINDVSSRLCTFIQNNHSIATDPVHEVYCKSKNAIFYENDKIGQPCPAPRTTPMFPDPAINPKAKIVTNQLVKPRSATVFTKMEQNKNIGRQASTPKPSSCYATTPEISFEPKTYNPSIKSMFNLNTQSSCFNKSFPSVNPTERNLALNSEIFYRNFTSQKPTTIGERLQIENAIKDTSYHMFSKMNDSIINNLPPVKQNQNVGAFM